MGIITRMRKQVAIYWALSGQDDYGNPTHDGPVAIDCRWEDITEEFIGPDNTREMSRAFVYTDRTVAVGSLLLIAPGFAGESGGPLGPLGNMYSVGTWGMFISGVATPTDPDMSDYTADDPKDAYGAWEVRRFENLPDLRADEFLKKAVL